MADEEKVRARARRWSNRVVVGDLADRVTALELEVEESRRLSARLAELTDVVQELLVPLAQSDPERVQEILERYGNELGS